MPSLVISFFAWLLGFQQTYEKCLFFGSTSGCSFFHFQLWLNLHGPQGFHRNVTVCSNTVGKEVKLHGLRTAVWRPGWGVRMYGGRNEETPREVWQLYGVLGWFLTFWSSLHVLIMYVLLEITFLFFGCVLLLLLGFCFLCLILGIPSLIHFDVNVHTNSDVNVELVVWSVCLVCWVARFGWLVTCRGLVEGRHGHRAGHHRHLATLKKHEKLHCHRWKKTKYYLT